MKEANETYDKLDAVLKGRPLPSWKATLKKYGEDIDSARLEYNNLDVTKDLNTARFFCFDDLVDEYKNSREEYVESRKAKMMVPLAFLQNSQWYERGNMGWFGITSNEMNTDDWNKQFWDMINSLKPDTKLTIIDCHI